jgi:hypothetical protein
MGVPEFSRTGGTGVAEGCSWAWMAAAPSAVRRTVPSGNRMPAKIVTLKEIALKGYGTIALFLMWIFFLDL